MTSTQYRPDVDGLRAVAVLAVVLNHFAPGRVTGGYVGVDVFFVISGYLITRIVRTEIEQGRFSFARFYQRRIKRLYPALVVCLAAVLVAAQVLLLPSDYRATLRSTLATLAFSSNIAFWNDLSAGYFAADAKLNPLLHTWSLAVEEQFYLLYPALLLACLRVAPSRTTWVLAATALVSFTTSAFLVASAPTAVFFLLPFRAWELLVGGLLAFDVVPLIRASRARELTSVLGLAAVAIPVVAYREDTTFPGLTALAPVLGAAALLHSGSSGDSLVRRLLAWKPAVYVGLTSYSLYLWHWPLVVFVRFREGMNPLGLYALALVPVSLAIGSLSYHWVEQRFRHAKASPRRTFAWAFAASGVLAIGAGIALTQDGFPGRVSPAARVYDDARTQLVPFVECDGRIGDAADPWCRLGAPGEAATVLLWGDSHMLAWGPALDSILRSRGVQAVFVPNSGCPPILDVAVDADASCQTANERVRDFLLGAPAIQTVIIAAYWSAHVTPSTAPVFASTLDWLSSRDVLVALIGPVPVFPKDVPLALALTETFGMDNQLGTSPARQRAINAAFWDVAERAARPGLAILDPVAWLCTDECTVEVNGEPIYRDRTHLSTTGARFLEPQLAAALGPVLSGPQRARTP